jgi:hypothetical protein
VADILFERRSPEGALAGFHTLSIELESFKGVSSSLFGGQNKGVGAERRQAQRLFRHGDPAAAIRHVPGRVHQVLGLIERIAGRAATDA